MIVFGKIGVFGLNAMSAAMRASDQGADPDNMKCMEVLPVMDLPKIGILVIQGLVQVMFITQLGVNHL